MVSVPLEWTIKMNGGQEARAELDRLAEAFNKAKASGGDFSKEQKALSSATNRRIAEGRLEGRLLLARHPMLLKVSRAMSTVTSISRSLLTISNALNISKISSQGIDMESIEIKKQIRANDEAIALELKKQHPDMEKINELRQENNKLMGIQKDKSQEIIDQKWDGMVTSVESAIFGIGTIFSNLINNPTILKALTNAGKFFGGVFAGFFTLMAKIGTKISDWMLLHLTGPSPLASATKSGGILGTAFGWAFTVAAAIAIATAAVLLVDIIEQKLFGTSPLKNLTGISGAEAIKAATGIDVLGFEPGSSDDPLVKSLHKNSFTQPIIPSVTPPNSTPSLSPNIIPSLSPKITPPPTTQKNKPADPQILEPIKQNNELIKTNNVLFKDLNSTIDDSAKIMIEGNSVLEAYYKYREQFDPTDKSARELMRMETIRLANSNNVLTSTSNAQIKAAADLTAKLGNIIVTVNVSKKGNVIGAFGSITTISPNDNIFGAGQFRGTNGKLYANQHEAFINGAWPVDALIAAAKGFNGMVNTPTMFLAGEAGPEHVNITPNGQSSGGNTIIVNVAGSVVTEKKIAYMVDQYQKQNLKSRGFTGFG